MGLFSGRVPRLGVREGRLEPCSGKPNCVCSQEVGPRHVEPFAAGSEAGGAALERLVQAALTLPRARLVEREGGYARLEFTTALFGFVDDVEFLLNEGAGVIHVRSASRLGRSDLGVNRRRVEEIRRRYEAR